MIKDLNKKVKSDKMLYFIRELTEEDIDEINEVNLGTFENPELDKLKSGYMVRELWEKGFNRKLTSLFTDLLRDDKNYRDLLNDIEIKISLNDIKSLSLFITDFSVHSYQFELSESTNNNREYSFYYYIYEEDRDTNPKLLSGRFDLDISVMYISSEDYKDFSSDTDVENLEKCYELIYNVTNKIFFNKYITEDYVNDDYDQVISKEICILRHIFRNID